MDKNKDTEIVVTQINSGNINNILGVTMAMHKWQSCCTWILIIVSY